VNAYLAALMLLAGLVAAAYGVATVLRLPGGAIAAAPLAWPWALAVALAVLGLGALRRRDIAGLRQQGAVSLVARPAWKL
jgi:putative exporter of polyketide antibiotics